MQEVNQMQLFNNIPDELKAYKQFLCWKLEDRGGKKPAKVPYDVKTGKLAKVNDPSTWTSFEKAREAVKAGFYSGLGFVLSSDDPFCFIDIDDAKGDQEILARQKRIVDSINSYTEHSPSMTGLHIIAKGKVVSGRKRDAIEIYSNLRYMTITGNVYKRLPITDQNEKVNALHREMGKSTVNPKAEIEPDRAPTASDQRILEIATNAKNGDKFDKLFAGNWEGDYPSQSEADYALMNILVFYSDSVEQVARLFRQSALGKRKKANRTDHVEDTIRRLIAERKARELPPIDTSGLIPQYDRATTEQAPAKGSSAILANHLERASMALNLSIPPRDRVVVGVMDMNDITVVHAPPKSFKSFFGLQLCVAIAAGRPVFGWKIPKARRVLIVNLEIKADSYRRRFRKMVKSLECELQPVNYQDNIQFLHLKGIDVAAARQLIEEACKTVEPAVVLLDCFYMLEDGEENSNTERKEIIKWIQTVSTVGVLTKAGSAVLLIHHDGKGNAGERAITDRGSGGGVINRAAENIIAISPNVLPEGCPYEGKTVCVEGVLREDPDFEPLVLGMNRGGYLEPLPYSPKKMTRRMMSNTVDVNKSIKGVVAKIADVLVAHNLKVSGPHCIKPYLKNVIGWTSSEKYSAVMKILKEQKGIEHKQGTRNTTIFGKRELLEDHNKPFDDERFLEIMQSENDQSQWARREPSQHG